MLADKDSAVAAAVGDLDVIVGGKDHVFMYGTGNGTRGPPLSEWQQRPAGHAALPHAGRQCRGGGQGGAHGAGARAWVLHACMHACVCVYAVVCLPHGSLCAAHYGPGWPLLRRTSHSWRQPRTVGGNLTQLRQPHTGANTAAHAVAQPTRSSSHTPPHPSPQPTARPTPVRRKCFPIPQPTHQPTNPRPTP
jgi:hypothetical protein